MTLGRFNAAFIREGLSPRGTQCTQLGFCTITSVTVNEKDKVQSVYSAEVAWLSTRDLHAGPNQGTQRRWSWLTVVPLLGSQMVFETRSMLPYRTLMNIPL